MLSKGFKDERRRTKITPGYISEEREVGPHWNMNVAVLLALFVCLLSCEWTTAEGVKCRGPPPASLPTDGIAPQPSAAMPADGMSIEQLSSEAHPAMAVTKTDQTAEPGGASAGYRRARMNRFRLKMWKAKLARKARRRLVH